MTLIQSDSVLVRTRSLDTHRGMGQLCEEAARGRSPTVPGEVSQSVVYDCGSPSNLKCHTIFCNLEVIDSCCIPGMVCD